MSKTDFTTMAADILQELADVDAKELQKGVSVPLSAYLDAQEVTQLERVMNQQGYHEYQVQHMRGERRVVIRITRW
jgi:preprotein translocase subunit SecF